MMLKRGFMGSSLSCLGECQHFIYAPAETLSRRSTEFQSVPLFLPVPRDFNAILPREMAKQTDTEKDFGMHLSLNIWRKTLSKLQWMKLNFLSEAKP